MISNIVQPNFKFLFFGEKLELRLADVLKHLDRLLIDHTKGQQILF